MSEKDANDNAYSFENGNNSEAAEALPEEQEAASESLDPVLDGKIKKKENESLDLDSYLPQYESQLKKEENPFSFKKFLNQESSTQKNKGARKKVFTPPKNSSSSDKTDLMNHRASRVPGDINSRISTSDMSSVLPDFVQDHLVIEQCYLSGSSPDIDINNLNLQNLPDLNLEHRNVHFMLSDDRESNHPSSSSDNLSPNLPDFTLGASNFQSGTKNIPSSKRLPDFTLHARTDANEDLGNSRSDINNANNTSQSFRHRAQISSSPSVPLDLPSYDESNQNLTIPFDLTAPTEETTSSCRGRPSNETVSKSLPDFLSDGPIKKEMNENFQNLRGIIGSTQNGLPSDISSTRAEDRLHREIDLLRCQLAEKNRRLERMEKELELLHSTDQRETASLEYALQEVENNLKQTAKRALNAEKVVLKLKQENKTLKSEISSLRSENVALRLGTYDPQTSSQEVKNQKIAKELKAAASQAESSLRSLLMGVDNLRALADAMENSHKFQDAHKDFEDFPNEDSASGPAL